MIAFLRQSWAGFLVLAAFTLVLGVGYPAAVYAVGQVAMPSQANGSMVTDSAGTVVGSALIAQDFTGDQWFQPRPSAVDPNEGRSGASNLGPNSPDLVADIDARRDEVAKRESVPPSDVPPDAVTASASGLDPDISPEYAAIQVPRVAKANGLSESTVRDLVAKATVGPDLGVLGESRVNVVDLNLSIANVAASAVQG